jgi:hypothetical protein
VRNLVRWAVALLTGVPPDDLSPTTLNRLNTFFVGLCAVATAAFVVALIVVLR